MSSSLAATLVIVTAKNCGGCINYKKRTESSLLAEIERFSNNRKTRGIGGMEVINIGLESTRSTSSSIFDRYHTDLKQFVGWFPTFLLFSNKSWKNKGSKLEGLVYNGEYLGGRWGLSKSPTSTDASHIMGWIKNSIAQNSIFLENILSSVTTNQNNHLIPIMSGSQTGRLNVLPPPQYGRNSTHRSGKIKFGSPISEEYTGDKSW